MPDSPVFGEKRSLLFLAHIGNKNFTDCRAVEMGSSSRIDITARLRDTVNFVDE
jgi:hypothetical protein